MPTKIFSISSHFVCLEAVSQKKYCCSSKVKHLALINILAGYATVLEHKKFYLS